MKLAKWGRIENLVVIISFLLCSIFIIKKAIFAAHTCVYSSWGYKVRINVYNKGPARSNYPVRLEIPTTPYIDSKRMRSDLGDVRFCQDGQGLSFWIHQTEGMNRNSYTLPIYVKLKNLNTGTNTIYMHFDSAKNASSSPQPPGGTSYLCNDLGPGVGNPNACDHVCPNYKNQFPFAGKTAGAYTFKFTGTQSTQYGLFAWDTRDTDEWNSDGVDFTTTGAKRISKQKFLNSFTLHFTTHFYLGNEVMTYFLLQGNTPSNIDSTNGYRLYIDYDTKVEDSYHWTRGRYYLRLYRRTASGETNVATSPPVYIYHNTIWNWDIRVSAGTIEVIMNGDRVLYYTRSDSFNGGYVGFKRYPITGGECGQNVTDGLSPIWVVNNYIGEEPEFEVMGNPDLEVKRVKPSPTESEYFGYNRIEYPPSKQIRTGYITGNSFDKYIYRKYAMANPDQRFEYSVRIRNRGIEKDTFELFVKLNGNTSDFSIAYRYENKINPNLPGNGATGEMGTITDIGPNEFYIIDIIVIPSFKILFSGGKLDLLFTVRGEKDMCVDTARFISYVKPRLDCYWSYKAPIEIYYYDMFQTEDLLDYQVLIDLTKNSTLWNHIKTNANNNGSDIIFTDQNGGLIPFWIKEFNKATDKAKFWVKIPKINAKSTSRSCTEAFDYAVFSIDCQNYLGGGNPNRPVVNNGSIHSNKSACINNPSHDIIDPPYVNDSPQIGQCPGNPCPGGSPNPNYKGDISFPPLDLDYYRTIAKAQARYYTTCSNVSLPTGGGVTMVEVTNGCTVSFSGNKTGSGILIIVGGNVEFSGNTSFTGLVYVKKSGGSGGDVTISGTSKITGQIIAEGQVKVNGTDRIYYKKQINIHLLPCPPPPPIPATATTTIYIWYGNPDITNSKSNIKETFDMYEDWEDRTLNAIIGCPDVNNSPDCSGVSPDPSPYNWKNYSTPANNFNWWRIRSRLDGKAIMADKGSSFVSSDIGPFVIGGDIRWKNYEVIYSFYDEYNNYGGDSDRGNPQYNPVCHMDGGNTWGMEFFATQGGLFIFRPFGDGVDWTWQYQANAGKILGDSTFPMKNTRYCIKVRPFYSPKDKKTYLSLLARNVTKNPISDIDSDSGFTYITERENEMPKGFIAPPAYAAEGGAIGFGGWNGGFSFDNIRVRKFVYPEPTYKILDYNPVGYRPIQTLSFPNITPRLLNGRPVMLVGMLKPWRWTGNLLAYYADCYISGDCRKGERQNDITTISLWGKNEDGTAKGFGEHLKEAVVGDYNPSESLAETNWKAYGRRIFTGVATKTIGSNVIVNNLLDFDLNPNNLRLFGPLLNVSLSETKTLTKFVRGAYIQGYSRSETRVVNKNMPGSTTDTNQWKLGDIIHSSPLVIGPAVMAYATKTYESFEKQCLKRDLVSYFGSNDGMLHCVRLAKYSKSGKYGSYTTDTQAREIWAFIPNEVLHKLKETTDDNHEYTVDGLFRAIDVEGPNPGSYSTILIGTLREGGESIFAIDITDPHNPSLLWELNGTNNKNLFKRIGKSSSAPALGKLKGINKWVAIFGSGLCEDEVENIFKKKAYLTVIDILTGEVIKQVEVSGKIGNITSSIRVIRDKLGYIEWIYFTDYYGACWRVKLLTETDVDTFLALTSLTDTNRFFTPEDYTNSNIPEGKFPVRPAPTQPGLAYSGGGNYWAYIPTGDYDAYDENYPYQRVYGLGPEKGSYIDSDLIDMTDSSKTNPNEKSWFIELGHPDARDYSTSGAVSTKDRNERCLSTPDVFGGYVFFTTFTPDKAPCEGGMTRFYSLYYTKGQYGDNIIQEIPGKEDVRSIGYKDVGVPSSSMIASGKSAKGEPVVRGLIQTGTPEKLQPTPGPRPTGNPGPIMVRLNSALLQLINIILWREIR